MLKHGYGLLLFVFFILAGSARAVACEGCSDHTQAWFYPVWAVSAPYAQAIRVRDTDSALGRYSHKTKQIGLKDMARIHGHLCDGLAVSFVEIKAVLVLLFPDGVVDRTDLRAVSKNSPCGVDAVSFMTGARINFRTLSIDPSVGGGFIIQRISTGEAYQVSLKAGVLPEKQAKLEAHIRTLRAKGQPVSAAEIDEAERLANQLSRKVLGTQPAQLVRVKRLHNFHFIPMAVAGNRGDIINKNMPVNLSNVERNNM